LDAPNQCEGVPGVTSWFHSDELQPRRKYRAAKGCELDELLTAVGAHRDDDAFTVLFDHFRPRVHAQMLRLGLAPFAAADVTQDVTEDRIAGAGIELVAPNESEQALIHEKYIHELLRNEFRPETRAALLGIIERMRKEDRVQAIILAGTELPLLLRGAEPEGLPFLDTTLIHVKAALDAIVNEEPSNQAGSGVEHSTTDAHHDG